MFIYFLFVFPEIGIFESGLPFQFHCLMKLLACSLSVTQMFTNKLYFEFFIIYINILIFYAIDKSNSYMLMTNPLNRYV